MSKSIIFLNILKDFLFSFTKFCFVKRNFYFKSSAFQIFRWTLQWEQLWFTQWSLEPNHLHGLTYWKVVSRRSSYCRDWHPNSTTYKPTNQNLHLQKVVHFITCAHHHLSFQGWLWLPRFVVQTSVVVWQASILEFVCRVLVWTCLLGPDTGNCGKF
jgi:REP element-mobilizing transposase RayT